MSTLVRAGETIAGYRVDGVLGSGGMGVVYRAVQLSLGREVALKVLAPHLSLDAEFRERFRREAALQAQLDHPHIVTVYETGESEEGLFLALQLVDGADLRRLVDSGSLAPQRALALLAQVAGALDAAHESGLVHRDVKPQNILVDRRDHAYLADFGVTKSGGARGLTQTGTYLGSLDYVAPEQVQGGQATPASDLYAFAALMFESLVGEVPFPRDTEAAVLFAHVSEPVPRASERRPALPAALDAVLERGLAKEPAERYASATELVDAARAAFGDATSPVPATEPRANGPVAGTGPSAPARAPRRFGETIVDGALLRRAPVVALDPERRPVPPIAWIALLALCFLLAVAGVVLGRSLGGGVEHPPQGVAVAGPIALTFPTTHWQPARARTLPGLDLADPVELDSRDTNGSFLLAGIAPRVGPLRLLPGEMQRRIGDAAARAERVRLGSYDALHWVGIRDPGVGGALTMYAVPVGLGAAVVVCRGELPRCEDVATTMALHGVAPSLVGADPVYAVALRRTLRALDAARVAERRAIAAADTPYVRAGHADVIASAYASAAAQLQSVTVPLRARSAHAHLLAALGKARNAYVSLSAALRAGDGGAYVRAATALAQAERAANTALRSLVPLGYAVASG